MNDAGGTEASGCGEADRWAGGCDAACGALIKVYPECHAATKIQLLSCSQGGRGLPRHRFVCWVQDRIKREARESESGVQ